MKRKALPTVASLPMIVRYLGVSDHGPCDGPEPSAYCPHCGSGGRYIHSFLCDDGTQRGAMAGCIQLFPVSEIARIDMQLTEREADLKKRFGKDAHLNSWDTKTREIVNRVYAGEVDKGTALLQIKILRGQKAAYRQRKTRGRI